MDAFEDTFEDPVEDPSEDAFQDPFEDPFDDDLIDECDDAFDDAFDVDDLRMVVPILNNAKIRSKLVSSIRANETFETLRPIERRSPGQN